MLPKKNRLEKKSVDEIFKKGSFVGSKTLNFKYILKNKDILPKISIIVPKSLEKSAVKRNFLKRVTYLAVKRCFGLFPKGILGVFILKDTKIKDNLEKELKNILLKANFMKK